MFVDLLASLLTFLPRLIENLSLQGSMRLILNGCLIRVIRVNLPSNPFIIAFTRWIILHRLPVFSFFPRFIFSLFYFIFPSFPFLLFLTFLSASGIYLNLSKIFSRCFFLRKFSTLYRYEELKKYPCTLSFLVPFIYTLHSPWPSAFTSPPLFPFPLPPSCRLWFLSEFLFIYGRILYQIQLPQLAGRIRIDPKGLNEGLPNIRWTL